MPCFRLSQLQTVPPSPPVTTSATRATSATRFDSGYPIFNTGNFGRTPGTNTPFIENNPILADLDDHYNGNYLTEETLLQVARAHGYNTASIGKVGPVAIQYGTQLNPVHH